MHLNDIKIVGRTVKRVSVMLNPLGINPDESRCISIEFDDGYLLCFVPGKNGGVSCGANDQAERLAVNARKLETETAKPTQATEPQAGSQFAPAPLLGDRINQIVIETILREKRPGGMLHNPDPTTCLILKKLE